jgi:hypothetical protein
MYAMGGHAQWTGRALHEFEIASESVGAFTVEPSLEDLQLESGLQPPYLSGSIDGARAKWLKREIAVVVNGVVRATTVAYEISKGAAKVAFLIPVEALKEGENRLELFAVGEDARLHRFERRAAHVPDAGA